MRTFRVSDVLTCLILQNCACDQSKYNCVTRCAGNTRLLRAKFPLAAPQPRRGGDFHARSRYVLQCKGPCLGGSRGTEGTIKLTVIHN